MSSIGMSAARVAVIAVQFGVGAAIDAHGIVGSALHSAAGWLHETEMGLRARTAGLSTHRDSWGPEDEDERDPQTMPYGAGVRW